jgi:Rad52/22 family double-strand break repair protein
MTTSDQPLVPGGDVRPEPNPVSLYPLLTAPFDTVFRDTRGGAQFDYLTGEQIVSRLNRVLGFETWSFHVLERGVDAEADEVWVLGESRVVGFGDEPAVRQQFGSQKRRRARSTGALLEIGFDLKAATTDCLKKCATLIGVGLYLTRKEEPPAASDAASVNGQARPAGTSRLVCADGGADLKATRFKDGTTWTPATLAEYGRRKCGRVLCMHHYRRGLQQPTASMPADPNQPA